MMAPLCAYPFSSQPDSDLPIALAVHCSGYLQGSLIVTAEQEPQPIRLLSGAPYIQSRATVHPDPNPKNLQQIESKMSL